MIQESAVGTAPRHRRRLAGVLSAGTTALLLVTHASAFAATAAALGHARPELVALGAVLSLAGIANRGRLHHAAHGCVGLSVSQATMCRTSAVSFAANKLVRSGGAVGIAVFVRHGRHRQLSVSTVTIACLLASVASVVATGVLVATTGVLLARSGGLSAWWLAAAGGFILYLAGMTTILVLAARSRTAAARAWARVDAMRCRVARRPVQPGTVVDDLYDAVATARSNRRELPRVLAHSVASKAIGAAMLLAAAGAAGVPITPSRAVIIYATSMAASFVSIVPGGFGVVEVATGAMFVKAGAPVPVAGAAVTLFRTFDVWLPLAIGTALARGTLRAGAEPDPGEPGAVADARVTEPALVAAGP